MTEKFATMLVEGGKSNSLGRTEEVIQVVLKHKTRLAELYQCLFEDDAWLRMRAADALEKVCRSHPEWLEPYVDRLLEDFGQHTQASIKWHLAQILGEVTLTPGQRQKALAWLVGHLQDTQVDWIVAANSMETLTHFAREGFCSRQKAIRLLKAQQKHRSNSVVKRATRLIKSLE